MVEMPHAVSSSVGRAPMMGEGRCRRVWSVVEAGRNGEEAVSDRGDPGGVGPERRLVGVWTGAVGDAEDWSPVHRVTPDEHVPALSSGSASRPRYKYDPTFGLARPGKVSHAWPSDHSSYSSSVVSGSGETSPRVLGSRSGAVVSCTSDRSSACSVAFPGMSSRERVTSSMPPMASYRQLFG